MHQQQKAFENIVEKEEIARNEQFLLFPQCFLLIQKIVSPVVNNFLTSYLYLLVNWKSLKWACEVKGQTKNKTNCGKKKDSIEHQNNRRNITSTYQEELSY